jgi:hypothetical protein
VRAMIAQQHGMSSCQVGDETIFVRALQGRWRAFIIVEGKDAAAQLGVWDSGTGLRSGLATAWPCASGSG